jgi:hypothetical protein
MRLAYMFIDSDTYTNYRLTAKLAANYHVVIPFFDFQLFAIIDQWYGFHVNLLYRVIDCGDNYIIDAQMDEEWFGIEE